MKVLIGTNQMGLEQAIPELQQQYPDLTFVYCPERDQIAEMIADAEIYMGWLNREAYLGANSLRWIQSPSSGVNYFLEIPELVESDVLLTSASGTHGPAVAESTMAMILAFTRGIRTAVLHQAQRIWQPRDIRPHMVELTGATMGIVGFGQIGRALAKRAKAFDMRVIAVDLAPRGVAEFTRPPARPRRGPGTTHRHDSSAAADRRDAPTLPRIRDRRSPRA